MNTCRIVTTSLMMGAYILFWGTGYAQNVEERRKIEIPQPEEVKKKPEFIIPPREEIKPEKPIWEKEVPKPVERTDTGPAEAQTMEELDLAYQQGRITQMEYELRKDVLYRESNVKF